MAYSSNVSTARFGVANPAEPPTRINVSMEDRRSQELRRSSYERHPLRQHRLLRLQSSCLQQTAAPTYFMVAGNPSRAADVRDIYPPQPIPSSQSSGQDLSIRFLSVSRVHYRRWLKPCQKP